MVGWSGPGSHPAARTPAARWNGQKHFARLEKTTTRIFGARRERSLLRPRKFRRELELEVFAGVAEADVAHHRADQLVIVRDEPGGHVGAQKIAERPAEIL